MAAQTLLYLYNQRQLVVLLEIGANANRRYQTVYAKDLIVNRGVDNLLEFSFVNQEQKPVDISGKTITCRLINYNGTEIILQKSLFPIYPLTGIAGLRITAAELQAVDYQLCYYSLEIPVDTWDYPVFVDAQGGARGIVRIVNSVLPAFVPSQNLTIPSHPPLTNVNIPVTYYSSTLYTKEGDFWTFQTKFEKFTGSIQFQGSTLQDFSIYYNITSNIDYTDYTGVEGHNITGYHPYIRIMIFNEGTPIPGSTTLYAGDLTEILVR